MSLREPRPPWAGSVGPSRLLPVCVCVCDNGVCESRLLPVYDSRLLPVCGSAGPSRLLPVCDGVRACRFLPVCACVRACMRTVCVPLGFCLCVTVCVTVGFCLCVARDHWNLVRRKSAHTTHFKVSPSKESLELGAQEVPTLSTYLKRPLPIYKLNSTACAPVHHSNALNLDHTHTHTHAHTHTHITVDGVLHFV